MVLCVFAAWREKSKCFGWWDRDAHLKGPPLCHVSTPGNKAFVKGLD